MSFCNLFMERRW